MPLLNFLIRNMSNQGIQTECLVIWTNFHRHKIKVHINIDINVWIFLFLNSI